MRLILACMGRDGRVALTRGPALGIDVASVLISAVVFYYLAEFVDHGASYFPYVLAGLTILRIHAAVPRTLQAATGRIADGSLEVLLGGRSRAAVVMIGEMAFELVRSVVLSVLLIAVAVGLLGADVHLTAAGLAAVAVGLVGAAAILAALALALLALLMVLREAGAVSSLSGVFLPIVSGVYFPRTILPTPLREITGALPFHLPVDVIRVGLTDGRFPAGHVAVLVLASAASLSLGALLVTPGVRHARRAGRLALE